MIDRSAATPPSLKGLGRLAAGCAVALALAACQVQPNTLGPGNAQATNAAAGHEYGIPPGHYPPSGMCRVWYPGRPPGQQPPVTTCAVVVPPGAILVRG